MFDVFDKICFLEIKTEIKKGEIYRYNTYAL